MENRFIPQAIDIVTQAINEDNAKNYQEAFRLYKKALEHFMVGVKCVFEAGRLLNDEGRGLSDSKTGLYRAVSRREEPYVQGHHHEARRGIHDARRAAAGYAGEGERPQGCGGRCGYGQVGAVAVFKREG
jgi:hypothetical protein